MLSVLYHGLYVLTYLLISRFAALEALIWRANLKLTIVWEILLLSVRLVSNQGGHSCLLDAVIV